MGKVFDALEKSSKEAGVQANEEATTVTSVGPSSRSVGSDANRKTTSRPSAGYEHPGRWDERLTKVLGVSGQLSELFRVLRSQILHPADEEKRYRTILVTSAAPGEGKSFVTANLAISLARGMDQYCLMVDCDLRRPALAAMIGVGNDPGLSDYLQAQCDVSRLIRKTSVEKLSLLASGVPPSNPSELLGSSRMKGLVQELSCRYDDRFVLIDSPPIQAASETSVLAKQVDGIVVVIRWGASSRDHVRKLVEDIGKEKIIGVVFNGYRSNIIESRLLKYTYPYQYRYANK